jgi:hypothetical protein
MANRGGPETHDLKLILSVTDRASKGLTSFNRLLKTIQTQSRATAKSLDALNRRVGPKADTSGLDKLIAKTRAYNAQLRTLAKNSAAARQSATGPIPNPLARIPTPSGRRRRSGNGFFDQMAQVNDLYETGQQVAGIWRDRIQSLEKYTDAALRLVRAEERFKTINLTPAENERAFAAVRETVKTIKGVSLADETEQISDLHTALGDLGHAIEAMPIAAKYRSAFSALYSDRFSNEEIETQVQNAMKFLEVSGKVARGRGEMERSFNVMAQMTAATAGRVNPEMMLQMARRGGPSVQGLSPEGLRNLSSSIQELNPEGTGVALFSTYRALVNGIMRQSSAEEFARLGLIDKSKIVFGKAQQIKSLKPEANLLAPAMMEDPLKAADMLMEAMKKKGIDTNNANKVREELGILFQRGPAFSLMSLLTTQRSQVVKEANISRGAKNIDQLYEQVQGGPLGKMQQYEKAIEDLKATIGQGLVPVMTKLAEFAIPIAKFFSEHPTVAKYAAELLILSKVGGGLVQTFGMLSQTRSLSFLKQAESASLDAAGAMSNAERKALGLSKGMGGLASMSPMKLSLTFLVAGFAVEKFMEWVSQYQEDLKNKQENQAASVKTYDQLVSTGRAFRNQLKPEEVNPTAKYALDTMKRGDTLELALQGGLERNLGDTIRLGNLGPKWATPDFDVRAAGKEWGHDLPQLHVPQVLATILNQLDQNVVQTSVEGREKIKQALELAVGKQDYQAATKLAFEQLEAIKTQSGQLGTTLNDLMNPASKLPPLFGQLGDAADRLASRFNNAQPTYNLPVVMSGSLNSVFGGPSKPIIVPSPSINKSPSFQFGGGRANGGRVLRGVSYIGGERGRELFVPDRDGRVMPSHALRRAEPLYVNGSRHLMGGPTPSVRPNISMQFSPTIVIKGDANNPQAVRTEVEAALSQKAEELIDRIEARLYYKSEREDERS